MCTLLQNNFQGPMFIRGFPYKITHITTVWARTTTVDTTGKQLSRPHVYQGFPPLLLLTTQTTTVYPTEKQLSGPHVYQGFPL